ncbi:hypothetical protein [uncultured Clostridium sp.]|uniref:hypothetical protein n=1 Tax=uncultured Clostridium sp. TaxID=59620 RepID=UPI0028E714E8|nr:hypothetical protein [uncultured Clostridium sp.]
MTQNTNNTMNMTEADKAQLRLLDIQKVAIAISIYSSLLLYKSTLEGIELIYSRYRKDIDEVNIPNPDATAIKAVSLGFLSQAMITKIAYSKYNILYTQYINGEFKYSLKPNMDINIGNTLALISYFYIMRGLEGIYRRTVQQPILGV